MSPLFNVLTIMQTGISRLLLNSIKSEDENYTEEEHAANTAWTTSQRAWGGRQSLEEGAGAHGTLGGISSIESSEVGEVRVLTACVWGEATPALATSHFPNPEGKPMGTATRSDRGAFRKTTAEPGVGLTITMTTQQRGKQGRSRARGTEGTGPPWVLIRTDTKGTASYRNGTVILPRVGVCETTLFIPPQKPSGLSWASDNGKNLRAEEMRCTAYSTRSVMRRPGQPVEILLPPRDTWQRLKTYFVVTVGRGCY